MNAAVQLVEQNEAGWDARKLDIIKQHLAPGIDDGNLAFFAAVCARTGLDPVLHQIYIIGRDKYEDGRKVGKTWTIQTGIDGYQKLAADTRMFAGVDRPVFGPIIPAVEKGDPAHPEWAEVTVYRMTQGVRCPFTAVVYWDEYAQRTHKGTLTGRWVDMPRNQLAKCARAAALRMGFPAELQGVYTDDEMGQAENPRIVEQAREPRHLKPVAVTRDLVAQLANALHMGATERRALFTQHGGDLNAIYRELTARAAQEADAPAGEEAHDLSELHVPGTNS